MDERERLVELDWVKLLAIGAVVFNHTCTEEVFRAGMQVTRFGNHAFTVVSCLLAFRSGYRSVPGVRLGWLLRRVASLYALFLIWNLLGYAARYVGALRSGGGNPFNWDDLLLSGFTLGLWFIPFIALANAAAFGAGAWMQGSTRAGRTLAGCLAVAVGGMLACSSNYAQWVFPSYFCTIALKNIPTTLFTLVLGGILMVRPALTGQRGWRSAALGCFALAAAAVVHFDRNIFLWESLMGLAAVIVFLTLPAHNWARPPVLLSIWIYVAHGIVIQFLRHVVLPARVAENAGHYWLWNLCLLVATLAVLLGGFALVGKTRIMRWLLAPDPLGAHGARATRKL